MSDTTGRDLVDPTRVLLVDDQALFRQAIATLLDAQPDMKVAGQADNGLVGVELARETHPDVVLLDMEMPVMDGLTAARLMLAEDPNLKILALSVNDDEHLVEALRIGVHGYLLKDLAPSELFEQIRAAARGETPISASLVGRLVDELRTTHVSAPANDDESPEALLSPRELEILQLAAGGMTNRAIARRLSITEGTVKNHMHNALHKLGMENRVQATAYLVRKGLASRDSDR